MKRYSNYKDSGVKWIGEIPSHWKTQKIKFLFKERTEKGYPDEPILCSTQKYGVIPQSMYENRVVVVNKGLDGLKLVNEGDFVISLRSFQGGIEYAYYRGIISAAYTILTPSKTVNPSYIKYLFKSAPFIGLLKTCVTGIREGQNINYDVLRKKELMLPSLDEQQRIVDYLICKTNKIEQYLAEKEREIEQLESLKQSEIANVVIKGLNPNVKMKDSGIPWIGKIPSHWKLCRAKYMFNKEKRAVRNFDDVITCFRDGQVTLRRNRRTTGFTESLTEIGYQGIREGDLVIHQMDAFAGSIGVSDSDGKGTSVYHCCTPKGEFLPWYYAHLLRTMAHSGFIQSLYRGIRERSSDFNFFTFGNQFLPIPPIEEQQAIVEFIKQKTSSIEDFISSLQSEIDQLKEYKQRLISDVVTGQVDVSTD